MRMKTVLIATGIAIAAIAPADLPWAKDFKTAVAEAGRTHKVVMVDFTASWCTNCHRLDKTTYLDPSVAKALGGVVPVRVDYDKERAIATKLKVDNGLPSIVFLNSKQHEIGRINGYWAAKDFIARATPILAKAKK